MRDTKPIEIKPSSGGRLMAGISFGEVGIANYTVKRDFRRYLDREIRSEGYDIFNPDPAMPATDPEPGVPKTLTISFRAPNGRTATVVGTKTNLYRYSALDNGAYAAEDYFAEDYVNSEQPVWIKIAGGLSPMGRRWEAVVANGILILNNGVDLPLTYRVQDTIAEPVHELREQGIASVGTIAVMNSILLCMDIRQLEDAKLKEIMSTIPAAANAGQFGVNSGGTARAVVNSGVAGEKGNIITATNADWNGGDGFFGYTGFLIRMANGLTRRVVSVINPTKAVLDGEPDLSEPNQPFYFPGEESDTAREELRLDKPWDDLFPDIDPTTLVGRTLYWESGHIRIIKEVDPTVDGYVVVDSDQPIPSGPVSLENPKAYAAFTDNGSITRFASRYVPAFPEEPRRFAAIIPVTVDPLSDVLRLTYPVKSLSVGQEIAILGAGTDGGNLFAQIQWFNGLFITVADRAVTKAAATITDAINAATEAKSVAESEIEDRTNTVTAARDALFSANDALSAAPDVPGSDEADLKQKASDASAKFDLSREELREAQAALVAAETALTEAQSKTQKTDTELVASDAIGSIVGFFDIQDDGSGILRALPIRNVLVVYKETAIVLLRYTANTAQPFSEELIPIPEGSALYFRNVLSLVAANFHIYAGRENFWRFDLVNRIPQLMPEFQACEKKVFFDQASSDTVLGVTLVPVGSGGGSQTFLFDNLDGNKVYQLTSDGGAISSITPTRNSQVYPGKKRFETTDKFAILNEIIESSASDRVFSADNSVTKEIFICFPSDTQDKALRYDYKQGTLSTTSAGYTAAATIVKPESQIQLGRFEEWFIMGSTSGELLRYGMVSGDIKVSGAVKASKLANEDFILTNDTTFFKPTHVGKTIAFANGQRFAIAEYLSSESVRVVGTGAVAQQAFVIENAIYHRAGQSYDSIMESGMESFGVSSAEKQLVEYVLMLSSMSPSSPVLIDFRGGANPSEAENVYARTIVSPKNQNLIPLTLLRYFLGDRITVSGMNNPLEISSKMLTVIGVNSHSFGRRP